MRSHSPETVDVTVGGELVDGVIHDRPPDAPGISQGVQAWGGIRRRDQCPEDPHGVAVEPVNVAPRIPQDLVSGGGVGHQVQLLQLSATRARKALRIRGPASSLGATPPAAGSQCVRAREQGQRHRVAASLHASPMPTANRKSGLR